MAKRCRDGGSILSRFIYLDLRLDVIPPIPALARLALEWVFPRLAVEAPKGFNSLLMPGNLSTATVSPRRRETFTPHGLVQGNVHQEIAPTSMICVNIEHNLIWC